MKAIVQDRYGSPDVLRSATSPTRCPPPTRCWCGSHAAAVNARDWHVMRGDPYLARLAAPDDVRAHRPPDADPGQRLRRTWSRRSAPTSPGGSPATRCTATSVARTARFAEYVAAPAALLDAKPAALTFEEAAALPLAGITALHGPARRRAGRPGHTRCSSTARPAGWARSRSRSPRRSARR